MKLVLLGGVTLPVQDERQSKPVCRNHWLYHPFVQVRRTSHNLESLVTPDLSLENGAETH